MSLDIHIAGKVIDAVKVAIRVIPGSAGASHVNLRCNIATSTAETKGVGPVKRAISSRTIDVERRVCSPQAEKTVLN